MEKTKSIPQRVLHFATAAVFSAVMCAGCIDVPTQGLASSKGLHAEGTKIVDGNGNEFVMRGMNTIEAWFEDQSVEASINKIAEYGSNAVRVVCANGDNSVKEGYQDLSWLTHKTESSKLASIIDTCKQNKMVAVLQCHNGTGSDRTDVLDRIVDFWIANKDLLNANKDYVVVNIANEWGDTDWNKGDVWQQGYVDAVKKLRNAGLENLLMIDCGGWGQNPKTIWERGQAVIDADSLHNTMFSIHMYEYAGSSDTYASNIDNALAMGVPLCIGEFAAQHTHGDVDEQGIMNYCEQKHVSYLGWSWTGNSIDGLDNDKIDIATDWSGNTLTSWGKTLVDNIQKSSFKTCSIYTGVNPPVDSSSQGSSTSSGSSGGSTVVGDGKLIGTYEATTSENVYIPYADVSKYDEISFRIVPLNPEAPPVGKCDNGCIGYNERANGGWNSDMEFCLDGATDYPQGVTTGVKKFEGKTLSIKKGEFFPGCDNGGDAAFAIQYWGSYGGIKVEVYAGAEAGSGSDNTSSVTTPVVSTPDSSSKAPVVSTPDSSSQGGGSVVTPPSGDIDTGILSELAAKADTPWCLTENMELDKTTPIKLTPNADGSYSLKGVNYQSSKPMKDPCFTCLGFGEKGLDWSKNKTFTVIYRNNCSTSSQVLPIFKLGSEWSWSENLYQDVPAHSTVRLDFPLEDFKNPELLNQVMAVSLRIQGKTDGDVDILAMGLDVPEDKYTAMIAEANRPKTTSYFDWANPFQNNKSFNTACTTSFANETITINMDNASGQNAAGIEVETCPGEGRGIDLSPYKTVTATVENPNDFPVDLTLLWRSGNGVWYWQECPASVEGSTSVGQIPAGFKGTVTFNVQDKVWKNEENGWKFTSAAVEPDDVYAVDFKVYPSTGTASGKVMISDLNYTLDGNAPIVKPPVDSSSVVDSSSQGGDNPGPGTTAGGFHTDGTKVLDANGEEFVMRGVNTVYIWQLNDGPVEETIDKIAEHGANAVRVAIGDGDKSNKEGAWGDTSLEKVQEIVECCKKNKMICILEIHNTTGDNTDTSLTNAANYWIKMKDYLNSQKAYVIVNIGNEWFGAWREDKWAKGYQKVIPMMRNAGIENLLMVDAAGYGQMPSSIWLTGKDVVNADALNNMMFSIHMYEYAGGCGDDPYDAATAASNVKSNIDNALSVGVPLCIGEFATQHKFKNVDYQTILDYCQEKNVGHLAWSYWGNGQEYGPLDLFTDHKGSALTNEGEILFNGKNGIKETAKVCSVFEKPPVVDSSSKTDTSSSTPVVSKPDSSKVDSSSTVNPPVVGGRGDLDSNGTVDSADALMILKNIVGLVDFDSTQKSNADLNNDGKIDTLDALQVLKYVVGLSTAEDLGITTKPVTSSSVADSKPVTPSTPDSKPADSTTDSKPNNNQSGGIMDIDPGILGSEDGWYISSNGNKVEGLTAKPVKLENGGYRIEDVDFENGHANPCKDVCLTLLDGGEKSMDWSKYEKMYVVVRNNGNVAAQVNPIVRIGPMLTDENGGKYAEWSEDIYFNIDANQTQVVEFALEDFKNSDGKFNEVHQFMLRIQGKSNGDIDILSIYFDGGANKYADAMAEINRPKSMAAAFSSLTHPSNGNITYKNWDATAAVSFDEATDMMTVKMNNADGDKYAGFQFETCPGMGTGLDYSAYKTCTMEVENLTGSDLEMTMLWQTGQGWYWQECPAVAEGAEGIAKIPAGYKGTITFQVGDKVWKNEETDWVWGQAPVELDVTKCVGFKIYGSGAPATGELKMGKYECHF